MTHRVTADEIAKARQVHLIDYLEAKGVPIIVEGNRGSYYRHSEHDSLVFKDNMYYWNSRQEKGAGAVSFAMMYYSKTFPEAVTDVNECNIKENAREIREEREKANTNQPFIYPDYLEVKDRNSVENYLVNERKIDKRVVDWLFKKDLLVQDKKNNAVFKWRENGGKGKIVGANRQGTVRMENKRGTFKQIMPDGKLDSGFILDIGKPKKIYAFESTIDMLSYWSIKKESLKDARLISMDGVKPRTIVQTHLDAAQDGHKIEKWVLSVDHDKAGLAFIDKMKTTVNPDVIEVDIPKNYGDDWNDELKKQVSKVKEKSNLMLEKIQNIHALER